jgi:MinD superfamily P-loop ATPase
VKQLLILSGKGGTGKTTVASAFIKLSRARAYADCDVDAPNLHLTAGRLGEPVRSDYFGMPKAVIDPARCTACGLCMAHCRFDAIAEKDGMCIDPYACEGCGVCEAVCPEKAISLRQSPAGELMLYVDEDGVFSTAQLKMGSGTTGMLVTEVKRRMNTLAPPDTRLAVIDGSPGIGCPVIASLSGVDMVLLVAEPSVSGISDLERIIKTAGTFKVKIGVCVNKYDTNLENTEKIKAFCAAGGLPFLGTIPFDPSAVKAVNKGLTVTDIDCPAGAAVTAVFYKTMRLLFEDA